MVMEHIFLVKIQTNCQLFVRSLHTIKIQNLDHQNWSDFVGIHRNLFFCLLG